MGSKTKFGAQLPRGKDLARHCKVHLPVEMAGKEYVVKPHSGIPGILVKTTRTIYRCTITGCAYVESKDEPQSCVVYGL